MDSKKIAFLLISVAIASFFAGKHLSPVRIETKVIEIQVEKSSALDLQQHNTSKIEKITLKPDGTVQKTTKTTTNLQKSTHKLAESQKITKQEVLKIMRDRTMSIHALWISPLFGNSGYGALLTIPILGPFDLGAFAMTNRSFGLSLGVSF